MSIQTARTQVTFTKHATDRGNYWTSPAPVAAIRHQLRALIKAAAIGGEQEQGFEQAFSSLAFAFLKDKAPRLLDYIVGFQLVDRNEDNTKAVGVFGFKVGKQWLYAPVFFLNGDLKGHELLYIKNQDVFVPMKENWVNYVLARKPHTLGEGSEKDVYQLGGLAPNIERLSWPPNRGMKYSADASGNFNVPGVGSGGFGDAVQGVKDIGAGINSGIGSAVDAVGSAGKAVGSAYDAAGSGLHSAGQAIGNAWDGAKSWGNAAASVGNSIMHPFGGSPAPSHSAAAPMAGAPHAAPAANGGKLPHAGMMQAGGIGPSSAPQKLSADNWAEIAAAAKGQLKQADDWDSFQTGFSKMSPQQQQSMMQSLSPDTQGKLSSNFGVNAADTSTYTPGMAKANHMANGWMGGMVRPQLNAGVHGYMAGHPDFGHAAMPKAAADITGRFDSWVRPFIPLLAAAMTKSARVLRRDLPHGSLLAMEKVASAPFTAALAGQGIDLREVLASDLQLAHVAWNAYKTYPLLKRGFDQFYGKDLFRDVLGSLKQAADTAASSIMPRPLVKTAARRPRIGDSLLGVKAAAGDPPKVRILTSDDVAIVRNKKEIDDVDTESKKQILRHGYLVRDERKGDEVSTVYNTQVRQTLTNPTETGLYDVLERPGGFDRMLIISNPVSNEGNQNMCTVVRLGDGEKDWLNGHRASLFARSVELDEDYRKWFASLGGKDSLEKGGLYLAISEQGEGTVPFEVTDTYPDSDDQFKLFKVNFKTSASHGRPGYMPRVDHPSDPYDPYISAYGAKLVINTRQGTKLRAVAGELHVPDNFRFLKLKDPPKPRKDDKDSILCCSDSDGCGESHSKPRPIMPGDIKDIQLLFTSKTAALKVHTDQHETHITSKLGTDRFSGRSALFSLIAEHGLGEKQALELLKTATARQAVTVRIDYGTQYPRRQKAADNYPGYGGGPTSPTIPAPNLGTEPVGRYNSVNSIYPQEEQIPVPGLDSAQTDPSIYDPFLHMDPQAVQTAQTASQQGQKEIFDTSVLSGLLKATSKDSLVDKYLPKLMQALDALGRLLLLFYWHEDDFADRYGQSAMPELEDTLRNTFEQNGDCVLWLREKSVEPEQGGEDGDPSIQDAARN